MVADKVHFVDEKGSDGILKTHKNQSLPFYGIGMVVLDLLEKSKISQPNLWDD